VLVLPGLIILPGKLKPKIKIQTAAAIPNSDFDNGARQARE
jgi:hypothetical protein